MLTEPLTGARKPEQTDGPLGGVQISNAVDDLAPLTIPEFTTTAARDAAYSAWDTAGGTMRRGLQCTVAGVSYIYTGSAWVILHNNAGTSANSMAGSVPPAAAPLRIKVWKDQLNTNASGDATVFMPVASFTNGLMSVSAICATGSAQPFTYVAHSSATSSVGIRAYNITTGTPAGSLSITTAITMIGW